MISRSKSIIMLTILKISEILQNWKIDNVDTYI